MNTSDSINTDNNPLLEFSGLPRFDVIKANQIEPALDELLQDNRALVDRLTAEKTFPIWDNFIDPLEQSDDRLERMWAVVSHLHAVMDSEPLRKVYEACLPKLTAYYTEMGQNEQLYRRFKQIADSESYATLDDAQRKTIDNALRDFRLAGVDLPAAEKNRFMAISQQLSTLNNRFEQNLLDATNGWHVLIDDENDLAGLPQTAIDLGRQEAEHDGADGWKFTLHAPSYIPLMTYAENRELRRLVYEAYVTRASDTGPQAGQWDNGELIPQVLQLRQEQAALLGFANYAEYSLVSKMARDVEEVMSFLRDLATRSRTAAEAELEEVRQHAKESGIERLEAWDIPYISEKLRQSRYAFTQEDVRAYFPVPKVLEGLFAVVNRLFGIEVRFGDAGSLWHEDVRFYDIVDEAGDLCGRFYLDLYARPHKRGGAWMADCINRRRDKQGNVQIPVAFLTCNITPPVGDKPALLTHDEVITIFHEFGHGLHHMLTRIDYSSVSGISGVAWDAVELPSQFLENWCWEREALDLMSGHYDTGESLPDDLLQKMRAAKNFQSALQMLRQIEFAMFDLRLHSEFDPNDGKSVQQMLDEVREEVAVVKPPAFNRFQNSFTHVFAGGYAAGYYSYKWAEVLSADAFSRFEEEGVFDRETGYAFKHNILEKGGAYEPMELFVAFRGREPTVDALLRHSGLAA